MSVLVFEKRPTVAEMIVRVLESSGEFSQICPAIRAPEVLQWLRRQPWTAVVAHARTIWNEIDLLVSEMPPQPDGFNLVVMVDEITDTQLEYLLRLPVAGIHSTADPLQDLIDSCRRERTDEEPPVLSPTLLDRVRFDRQKNVYTVKRPDAFAGFTLRQVDILHQLARGRTVKEIANRMFLSPRSVESHKYRIMRRLEIHDRVELCRYAIREGLIQP